MQVNQESVSQAHGRSPQTHFPSHFCIRGYINVTRLHSSLIVFVLEKLFFHFHKNTLSLLTMGFTTSTKLLKGLNNYYEHRGI